MDSIASQELEQLAAFLRPHGEVRLSKSPIELGLHKHTLTFYSDGKLPITWPVNGSSHWSFVFDESTGAWSCIGNMYGVQPEALTPKIWFNEVTKGLSNQEHLINGMLQKAATLWERYNGDLEQYTYRLGVEFSAIGVMEKLGPGHYVWHHAAAKDVVIAFSSVEPERKVLGQQPHIVFGFYPPKQTHIWEMTVQNLMTLRTSTQGFVEKAKGFLAEASACVDRV